MTVITTRVVITSQPNLIKTGITASNNNQTIMVTMTAGIMTAGIMNAGNVMKIIAARQSLIARTSNAITGTLDMEIMDTETLDMGMTVRSTGMKETGGCNKLNRKDSKKQDHSVRG